MPAKKKSSSKKKSAVSKKTPSKKVASARREPVLKSKKVVAAFKNQPVKRDAFGRFLSKLKRNALGRFVPKTIKKETIQDAKQVQRTNKSLSKTAKKIASIVSPGNKTAKKPANKSSKKIATKKPSSRTQAIIEASNKLDKQRIYTLRDFPYSQGKTFAEWINSIEDHADEIDAQLRPGEMFYGMVDGHKTIIPYQNISSLLSKLIEYVEEHVPKGRDKLIEKFGIITFLGSTKLAQEERKKLVEKRKKESREAFKALREEVGATKEEIIEVGGKKMSIQRRKTTAELISETVKAKRETDARIAALEAQVAKLLASTPKKVAKKAAKKTTKKKGK